MSKFIVVVYTKGSSERLLKRSVDIFSSLLKRFHRKAEFLFVSADVFLFGTEKYSEVIGGRKIDAIIYDYAFREDNAARNRVISYFGVKAHVYYINAKRIVAPVYSINSTKGFDTSSDEFVLDTQSARTAAQLAIDLAMNGRHEITLCTGVNDTANESALVEEYEFAAGSVHRLYHFRTSIMWVLYGNAALSDVVISTPLCENFLVTHTARQEGASGAALCCVGEHFNAYGRAQIFGEEIHNEHIRGLLLALAVMAQNEFESNSAAVHLRYAIGIADKLVTQQDDESYARTVLKIVKDKRRTGDWLESTTQ